jgi:hypothetical protein
VGTKRGGQTKIRSHVGNRHNEACDAAPTAAMKEKRDGYPAYCMKSGEAEARD